MKFFRIKTIIFAALLSLILPGSAGAFGDIINFNVDKDFDASGRNQVTALLIKTTDKIYFYAEKSWWDSQNYEKKSEILAGLDALSTEYGSKIYPTLSSVFGSEWRPGVDGDDKITVLFESMNRNEGGYFREADEYIKLQIPTSNEREMVYISLDKIQDPQLKALLAHELVHLITFNQKNKKYKIEEETWLNEARADYSSTILGYDIEYEGSNLQQRVNDFISNPSDSVTEWVGSKYDYASVSLFTNYLVDQYGLGVLMDSLNSKYVGIDSINYALQKVGMKDTFSQIFTNWTIASFLNNCSISQKYCYLNQNLKNLRLAPLLNFLPVTGDISLSVTNGTKNWAGNWLKFIGGKGDLELDFSISNGLNFQVPYILSDSAGSFAVKFLALDKNGKGKIEVGKFGTDYKSLVIIPSLQPAVYKADEIEPTYLFSYIVAVSGEKQDNQDLIQQLLDRISVLKQEIAKLIRQRSGNQTVCAQFGRDLYIGMSNNEVKCLQEFLIDQGQDIYPEKLVTGNFAAKTKAAVIRFQEKYSADILAPLGLSKGTGYVGPATIEKINQILSGG